MQSVSLPVAIRSLLVTVASRFQASMTIPSQPGWVTVAVTGRYRCLLQSSVIEARRPSCNCQCQSTSLLQLSLLVEVLSLLQAAVAAITVILLVAVATHGSFSLMSTVAVRASRRRCRSEVTNTTSVTYQSMLVTTCLIHKTIFSCWFLTGVVPSPKVKGS